MSLLRTGRKHKADRSRRIAPGIALKKEMAAAVNEEKTEMIKRF